MADESEFKSPFKIDMAAVPDADRDAEFESRYGGDVPIVFVLPDGSTHERVFKMGNQVEQLKGYIEQSFGIPYGSQSLFLGDEFMIDPLSLSDFPAIKPNQKTQVSVRTN